MLMGVFIANSILLLAVVFGFALAVALFATVAVKLSIYSFREHVADLKDKEENRYKPRPRSPDGEFGLPGWKRGRP